LPTAENELCSVHPPRDFAHRPPNTLQQANRESDFNPKQTRPLSGHTNDPIKPMFFSVSIGYIYSTSALILTYLNDQAYYLRYYHVSALALTKLRQHHKHLVGVIPNGIWMQDLELHAHDSGW